MKRKKPQFNPYGLRVRLGLSMIGSALACIVLFLALNFGLDYLISHYYEHSGLEQYQIQRQQHSLQTFVESNQISTKEVARLKEWEKKQPIILLELYAEDQCIYSSVYDAPVSSRILDENVDSQKYTVIEFSDRQAIAFLYSDFTYQFSIIGTVISIVAALVLFVLLFLHSCQKMIRYICRLNQEVQILEGGNLEYDISEEGNDELTDLARSMNRMKTALQRQMETEQRLHQANRQLITEMSHDLRTPLTGILLYLEILRTHHYESQKQLEDYLEKIDTKAHHMKLLSDHLFAYSLQEPTERQTQPQTMESAFRSAINAMGEELLERGFQVETELEWKSCFVQVNPEYIQRILENIISNLEKYGEKQAPVRMDTIYSDQYCGFSVMNTFSEDCSNIESNGVGIESIRHRMEQMSGKCFVERTDTTFEITLLFPKK